MADPLTQALLNEDPAKLDPGFSMPSKGDAAKQDPGFTMPSHGDAAKQDPGFTMPHGGLSKPAEEPDLTKLLKEDPAKQDSGFTPPSHIDVEKILKDAFPDKSGKKSPEPNTPKEVPPDIAALLEKLKGQKDSPSPEGKSADTLPWKEIEGKTMEFTPMETKVDLEARALAQRGGKS